MDTTLRYSPSFATLFVTLMPGESILAEADAMTSMSGHTRMRTRLATGLLGSLLRRFVGGESMFINEFYCDATSPQAQLVLSQPTMGDITCIQLQGTSMHLQPGAFIACTSSVEVSLGFAGFASWFSGEGLFRLTVKGHGMVWVGGYGGIMVKDVPSEYLVDTSHLLAYEPTISLGVRLSGGVFSSVFGGEGFVTHVKGPGRIYLQSRSMETLADWTNQHLM
jgi:uncharacterized protein (TIGR00266 family)